MKSLIALLVIGGCILFVAETTHASNWLLIHESTSEADGSMFLDGDSVVREGSLTKVWIKVELSAPIKTRQWAFQSMKVRYSVSCEARTTAPVEMIFYSDQFASGKILSHGIFPNEKIKYAGTSTGSFGEDVVAFVCPSKQDASPSWDIGHTVDTSRRKRHSNEVQILQSEPTQPYVVVREVSSRGRTIEIAWKWLKKQAAKAKADAVIVRTTWAIPDQWGAMYTVTGTAIRFQEP